MANEKTYCTNKELAIYCGLLVDALVDYFCLSPKRDAGLTTDEYEEVKSELLNLRDKYYNDREDEKERDRRRKTLRGQFEAAMECFNPEVEEADNPYLSDDGNGAELIRFSAADHKRERREAIENAINIITLKAPKCLFVLKTILKNGTDNYKNRCDIILEKALHESKLKPPSSPKTSETPKSTVSQDKSSSGT